MKILLIAIGCAMLAYQAWMGYLRIKTRQGVESHLISHTKQTLANVESSIKIYYLIERCRLTTISSGVKVMTGRELYSTLSNSPNALFSLRPSKHSARCGVLVDEWEREIHATIEARDDRHCVVLWSDGPNKTDDQRRLDDIVREFDVGIIPKSQ